MNLLALCPKQLVVEGCNSVLLAFADRIGDLSVRGLKYSSSTPPSKNQKISLDNDTVALLTCWPCISHDHCAHRPEPLIMSTTSTNTPHSTKKIMMASSRNNEHSQRSSQQQTLQLTKPFILLVSFLLYLNLSLLRHVTFNNDNIGGLTYRRLRFGWFPEVMNLRRRDDDDSNDITDDVVKQHAVNSEQFLLTVEQQNLQQQQQQEQEQQEQDEDDKNRQWKIEGQITGLTHTQKLMAVPTSFKRYNNNDKKAAADDVNSWWKIMEEKIVMRQQKQQQMKDGATITTSSSLNSENKGRGKIALIMSYPNSGTSYTSKLVRMATGYTTATNYGFEALVDTTEYKSVPVYTYSSDGPYWLHPPIESIDDTGTETGKNTDSVEKKETKQNVLPVPPSSASILTKTHCGIRCTHCPPYMYMENEETFYQRCLSGSRKVPDNNNKKKNNSGETTTSRKYKKEYVTYSPNLINSTIHLIRNPFDNAISRFHHELKEHTKNPTKYQYWIDRYPRNKDGFRKWCNDEYTMYGRDEVEYNWSEYFGKDDDDEKEEKDIVDYFEGVSCHAEMVRYALWHKLALSTVDRLGVPVLYLYYEDYAVDLEGEANKLLNFLNLPRRRKGGRVDANVVGVDGDGGDNDEFVDLPEFRQSDYSDYFTLEERAAISDLIRQVFKNDTKGINLLDRYFTGWDFGKLVNQTQDII